MKIEITTKESMNSEEGDALFFPFDAVNSLILALYDRCIIAHSIKLCSTSLSDTIAYYSATIFGKDVEFYANLSDDGRWYITKRN